MTEILALLQHIAPLLEPVTFRQMSRIIFAMLVISGRITMLGLSRWADKGGSYRTIQCWYHTPMAWEAMHWLFFVGCPLQKHEYIIAGDEVVIGKAGTETHKAKKEARKSKKSAEKGKVGRPKGSKNKVKSDQVELNPELLRIEQALKSLLETVGKALSLKYVVLDGHFGNYPSVFMVRNANLHLISKMRSDVALYPPFEGEYPGAGRPAKYGKKLNARKMDEKYLKATTVKDNLHTDIYQGIFYNKEFAFALNVVIILKTNLLTNAQAHVVLFSTDLEQDYEKIILFYSLRFQIEFNFRGAKQYWGLEDFMNIKETAVTNAANLSLFMVNFSLALLRSHRRNSPDFSVLDLKSYYRGCRYASETKKNASAKT